MMQLNPSQTVESTATAPRGGGRLRAFFELVRLPNVFTVFADIAMGAFFAHWYFGATQGMQPPMRWDLLALLMGASAFLYWAGMTLNDVYDVEQDRAERPGRPIPSGRIPLRVARFLGFELMAVGVLLACLAWLLGASYNTAAVAVLLALCIVAYDAVLKKTLLGPVAMGGCRFFNVLLGMSIMPIAFDTPHYWIAAGLGLYISGITWFARTEGRQSNPLQLLAGMLVMMGGIAVLATFPAVSGAVPHAAAIPLWNLLWGVLGLMIAWRCMPTIISPSPRNVQFAVKQSLMSLIMLNAVLIYGITGPAIWPALSVLALLPLSMILGRMFYST